MSAGPIFFISGAPGVGKSTTGVALSKRFEKAVLFNIDYFRQLVVQGVAHPVPRWTEEVGRQFALAHVAVGKAAQVYSEAGFAVIAEHASHPHHLELFVKEAPSAKVACLYASVEKNHERNLGRTGKSFEPETLNGVIEMLAPSLYVECAEAGYATLNTTDLQVEDAVAWILNL
jgi:hypothetical protein